MKLFGCQQIAAILTVLVAVCCVSCNRPATTAPPAAAKTAKPGPEESLTEVMAVFKRLMEETPIGFVKSGPTGRTFMTGANEVSYDLIRPATDGNPYKAVVTVKSQAHYSILRTTEGPNEDSRDKKQNDQSTGALDEADPDAVAFDSGDSQQTSDEGAKQNKTAIGPGEDPVKRKEVKEERKYELIYENERWRLVTKLDEKTEKATENAFDNALNTQI